MGLESDLKDIQRSTWEKRNVEYNQRKTNCPKVLYHYTNLSGLKGILKNRSIWATHAGYLNDPHEVVHGRRIFRELLGQALRKAKEDSVRVLLEKCNNSFDNKLLSTDPSDYYYCASFSELADELSQYRAYSNGGSGYCIGFHAEKIMAYLNQNYPNFFDCININYDEGAQRKFLDEVISDKIREAEELAEKYPKSINEISNTLSQSLIQQVNFVACLWKQSGFHEEREWRIIPSLFGGLNGKRYKKFPKIRDRDDIPVPYLEIQIADEGALSEALSDIYVGPRLPYEKAKTGLFYLLNSLGINTMVTKPSKTALL